jgi:alpha-1,6-mannosyltransferase
LCTAVLYIGLGLLVWGWVRLGRDVRAGLIGNRMVLVAIALWSVPLLLAPPLFSHDLYTYLAQGDLSLHGLNPYAHTVSELNDRLSRNVDPTWSNTPTPYGPLFILVAKCVVAMTGQDTGLGLVGMRLAMGVGMVLICRALPKLAQRLGGRGEVALWFGAANPLVVVYLVGGGHNDLLMVGLLATGFLLALDGRHVWGFVLVTLAFGVKATAVVALPFLVWIWANRLAGHPLRRFLLAAAGGIGITAVVFTACTLAGGVDLGWIPALSTSDVIVEWFSVPTATGQLAHVLIDVFDSAIDQQTALGVTRAIGWLALAGLVGRQWWLARAADNREIIRRATIALFIVTVFSPATLPWYFTWTLVLGAGFAWTGPGLLVGSFGSVFVLMSTYPNGTTGLYTWAYLAAIVVFAAIAALALFKPPSTAGSASPVEFAVAARPAPPAPAR